MYLYYPDTQTTKPQELKGPRENRSTVANFYLIYVKFFDWKSAHLMQGMLQKRTKIGILQLLKL